MTIRKYRLYEYDVWGNKREGYDVNNVFRTSHVIELDPDMTDKELVYNLKNEGFIRKSARFSLIEIDGDEDYMSFSYNDMPAFELRRE